ncbi:hypothetical protein RFI_09441 [Reticulomyxa filosa]|uniref:Calcineurin-like phosphoesterase domain-containing protein n=1 Tax=Reticulomyxa filosa TaxID=46433 RepID=X6NNU6_RETFI|nr:hypothetical protein RFI_09441 [Reticulomyxa filosa]|eukprot:ETO27691.1 hypothetical protein RFI_09441 [Reticulomyxa filosa]
MKELCYKCARQNVCTFCRLKTNIHKIMSDKEITFFLPQGILYFSKTTSTNKSLFLKFLFLDLCKFGIFIQQDNQKMSDSDIITEKGNYCGELHLPRNRYKSGKEESKEDNDSGQDVKRIRIVHISDTHLKHQRFEQNIPDGDILIHSGDFSDKKGNSRFMKYPNVDTIKDFNEWLGARPHKFCKTSVFQKIYKIFVSGNHETNLMQYNAQQVQELLTNCIYLQDSGVELFGINFYGSPYMARLPLKNAYATTESILRGKWDAIPSNTDILITHTPPFNILDLAWGKDYANNDACAHCGDIHVKYDHWGDSYLKTQVLNRIRPLAHLFGHVHDDFGFKTHEGVLFVNSSMDLSKNCHYMDVIFDLDKEKDTFVSTQDRQHHTRKCVVL